MSARALCLALRLPPPWRSPSPQVAIALGDKVEAGSCGIANSGSASSNTVTCNFGLTPEQLKQVTEAAVKGATGPCIDRIDGDQRDARGDRGRGQDAAEDRRRGPEHSGRQARRGADQGRQRLQAAAGAGRRVEPGKPDGASARREAKPEIDAGHFERAHELLRQATQAQIAAAQEARKLKEQAQAAEDAQMLGAASSTAAEGDVALTERRYLEAAELFGQAAGYVPSGHASERGGYLMRQADALYRQGDERGDNAALRSSIEVYGRALAEYPRSQAPLDWAATQNNLGNALRRSASGRAGRRGSRRRWRPIARRWRNGRASGFRSTGRDAEQSRHCARERSASGRAGRRGLRRRWRPIARRWRNGRASGFRSTGRRRRTISAMRSRASASGRAGRRGSRRRSRPIARRWRNGRASGFRSTGR